MQRQATKVRRNEWAQTVAASAADALQGPGKACPWHTMAPWQNTAPVSCQLSHAAPLAGKHRTCLVTQPSWSVSYTLNMAATHASDRLPAAEPSAAEVSAAAGALAGARVSKPAWRDHAAKAGVSHACRAARCCCGGPSHAAMAGRPRSCAALATASQVVMPNDYLHPRAPARTLHDCAATCV